MPVVIVLFTTMMAGSDLNSPHTIIDLYFLIPPLHKDRVEQKRKKKITIKNKKKKENNNNKKKTVAVARNWLVLRS